MQALYFSCKCDLLRILAQRKRAEVDASALFLCGKMWAMMGEESFVKEATEWFKAVTLILLILLLLAAWIDWKRKMSLLFAVIFAGLFLLLSSPSMLR